MDNSSALYGLVKGYSARPDSLAIIRAFHAANLAIRANVWFNYVASKANVADLPRPPKAGLPPGSASFHIASDQTTTERRAAARTTRRRSMTLSSRRHRPARRSCL